MDREVEVGGGARLVVRGIETDGAVVNADVELIDRDGQRWSATVLTVDEISRIIVRHRETGECLGGAYFRVPDLLILSDSSWASLVAIVEELLRTGEYRFEFSPLED